MITPQELVQIAGSALEIEDRYILGCLAARGDCGGGLLKNQNERYYQFTIWRQLMSRWDAKTEVQKHDLVISCGNGERAAIEIKRWFSANGKRELSGIQRDITKLGESKQCSQAFMMIISVNRPGGTDENLNYLQTKIPCLSRDGAKLYKFPTHDGNMSVEFWVGAWTIPKQSTPEK